MTRKKLLYLCTLFLLSSISIFAQQMVIKGTVSEATGTKLSGVNIQVKGSGIAISTGFDGTFSIKAEKGSILIFSYLGFKTKEVIANEIIINVVMQEDSQNLKEVLVTTSLGIKRQKRSLGYATQEIAGSVIEDSQRDNFITSLQGRVAGLSVTSTSGAPGSSAAIQLRGVNSMSGNNSPLFVIDGLPMNNSTLDQGLLISNGPNRDTDYTNRGGDLNPDDIESVTILKGPEAAALYGIQAGNGAIVITTKKGKPGEGRISINTDLRVENVYRYAETQQVYQRGSNGVNNINYRRHFGEKYPAGTQMFDNVGNFFQTGVTKKNAVSIDNATDKISYRVSLGNLNQEGVVPNSLYERLNASLTGTARINSKFKIETSLLYTNSKNQKATKGNGGFLLNLLAFPANIDARDYLNADGSRKLITDGTLDTEVDNPFFDVNKNIAEDKNNRFITNISATYNVAPWFAINGRYGIDANSTRGWKSIHPESNRFTTGLSGPTGKTTGGYFEQYADQAVNKNFLLMGTIKKNFGKFNSLFRFGMAQDKTNYSILSTKGEKFYVRDNYYSINNTDPLTKNSLEKIINTRIDGYFGEFSVDYDKTVYLSLTGRNDVASQLPRENNSFFYPSASLSFVFSELFGLKDSKTLSFGKIRASWARVANVPKAYSVLSSYEPKLTTGGGFGYSVTGANPNLVAEINTSTEIGTELSFLDNRLGLDVAAYKRKTNNSIINALRLSYGTGFVISTYNFGDLENKGLEISLKGTPIITDNFKWELGANFTKTDSELLSLPSTLPEYYTSDTWTYGNVRGGSRVGGPLTSLTGYDYLRNNNGDILIDPTNGLPLRDQTFKVIGDRNPDFMIGFFNNLRYKNFNFSFLMDIRKGGDVYNATELYLYQLGLSTKTLNREETRIMNGVLQDGLENSSNPTRNNIQVSPYYQNEYYNTTVVDSDFIERDINWLRMKEITVSYSMNSKVLEKLKVFKKMSIYVTMNDAFIITNYTGADPAVNALNASSGGAGGTGIDYGTLSAPRGVNFGLKLGL